MNSAFRVLTIALCMSLAFGASIAIAQMSPEELAKESEAFCATTASTKPTPGLIVEKVEKAAALVQKDGKNAFSKFKGKDSEFIFAGTYIWIHDGSGTMMMHPIKYKMEGQNYIDLKDTNGKLFFTSMNEIAKAKGSGWVDYMWPKPGEKSLSQKVSYVKLVKVGGEDLILGCGVYDMSAADLQQVLK
ncbi:MAG: cache domain-containing protein [Syntrophobacteraceae bacterium]